LSLFENTARAFFDTLDGRFFKTIQLRGGWMEKV
jgi:hypothetical protein